MVNNEQADVVRTSLIRNISAIRPRIIVESALNELTYDQLKSIWEANRVLDYYSNLIKQQKISVIQYVYEEKYTLVNLLSLSDEELHVLYLSSIRKSREEFNKELETALTEFRETALINGHEEYLTFSDEEAIIASGVLMPSKLLTEEEYNSKSLLLKIHNITKEIEKLNKENSEMQETIDTSRNYMLILDLRSDINYNNDCIKRLQDELKQLIDPNPDNLSLARRKRDEE